MGRGADQYLEAHPELLEKDETDPSAIDRACAIGRLLARYFRLRTSGFERIPKRPCLVVANHSSGAVFEVILLLHAWRKQLGDRPARGLMHRIAWEKPFDRLGLQKVGGVFAHPRVGLAALRRGMDLLVFPGGDVEAARPFGDRYQVTFAGRTGFVRLAREAGVPIAPVVICGAHAPYVILPGSQKLAKALGVERRFGSKVLPATIGSAVAAASLLLPPLWPLAPAAVAQCLVPWPSRIDVEAIDPIEIDPRLDDRAMSLVIEGRMQRAMDRMASARLTPWG